MIIDFMPLKQKIVGSCQCLLFLVLLSTITTSCATPSTSPNPVPTLTSTPSPSPATTKYFPTRGWRTATPEEQGMDSQKLAQMLDTIKQKNLSLHSLLIIRNGYIVDETYFQSYRQDSKHELYSCTKSFIATLVGIAIDKSYITGVNSPVKDFFPNRTFANTDSRKQAMTLEHLLTMTTGLDWVEGDEAYRQMYVSSDWVGNVMDKPMLGAPGNRFNYCSGCSHVLSAIVQQKTGTNTKEFARKELFEPLGISDFNWGADSQGIPIGGWGLQITPRDMAKLGYLYLNNGTWDGKQIVSANWVKTATERHTTTNNQLGYGYQWWTYPSFGAYTAQGRYGQTIFVIPNLNLVIVTTAGLDGHEPIFKLIEDYIVPAVQKP